MGIKRLFFSAVVFCLVFDITIAQLPLQKVVKMDKYVPFLTFKDSVFFHGIDSLIFNSVHSDLINNDKIKIFNIECSKENNSYVLNVYMLCQIHFLKTKELRGCFEYRNYLFLWYGDNPDSLWCMSPNKKKLTYLKGEPFDVPIIICDLAEFEFKYIKGELSLIKQSCN